MATRKFVSQGLIFDEGDIPECGYCGRNFDEVEDEGDLLYEAPTSGVIICNDAQCAKEYVESFQDITEEV